MCNNYAQLLAREEVRKLARAIRDLNNNQPPLPGIFPDYPAPVVNGGEKMCQVAGYKCTSLVD
jgi:3-hydroxymyristoyl/3-hydroxydecanoyl-(acyl carrier protein) dehydratase